ncbi:MAG: hypothetical protein HC921_06905 [Synechococcaceae cyanobacterium SM2_3_1]|nr:hypothetical protein [Synechococcaceae cyanobacterium SM2_3_1]
MFISLKSRSSGPLRLRWVGSRVLSFWESLLDQMLSSLTSATEPIIRYQANLEGSRCWHIFDPVSRRHYWVETEAEVREWIEQRYRVPRV